MKKSPLALQVSGATTVASLTSLLAASSVQADIFYFPSSSFTVSDDVSATVAWDVDGAGTILADFSVQNTYFNSRIVRLDFNNKGAFVSTNHGSLLALHTGDVVSAGMAFSNQRIPLIVSGALASVRSFVSGTPAFVGFSFTEKGTTCYGWASITITEGASVSTITVNEWAYEDSGAAITVGAVPEPAQTAVGLGALALGAAGLRRWRKNKAAKAA
jgi:hypothetical protein